MHAANSIVVVALCVAIGCFAAATRADTVPFPIGLSRLGVWLETRVEPPLSDEQRAAVVAAHDRYLEKVAPFQQSDLTSAQAAWDNDRGDRWRDPARMKADRSRVLRIIERLAQMDEQFFDDISASPSESQLAGLASTRLARAIERAAHTVDASEERTRQRTESVRAWRDRRDAQFRASEEAILEWLVAPTDSRGPAPPEEPGEAFEIERDRIASLEPIAAGDAATIYTLVQTLGAEHREGLQLAGLEHALNFWIAGEQASQTWDSELLPNLARCLREEAPTAFDANSTRSWMLSPDQAPSNR